MTELLRWFLVMFFVAGLFCGLATIHSQITAYRKRQQERKEKFKKEKFEKEKR